MSATTKRSAAGENGIKSEGKQTSLRFDGIYEAPIDNLGWPGRLLRHRLLDAIIAGSPTLVSIQKIRRPWLDTVMHFLSFLGSEDFYTGIIILLTWIFDLRFSRLFTILMGTAFYCTTASKNILRMPRPASPPVAVLETTYDWSLPSLHAVIGITLPGYLFFYPFRNYDLSGQEVTLLAVLIISWTVSVCFSRLYLGVHSCADIIVGLMGGCVLLFVYLQVDDALDAWLYKSQHTSLQALILYTVMLALHPQSGPPTHSFGETAVTCGVAFGMIIGYQRIRGPDEWYYAALLENNAAKNLSTGQLVGLSLGRVLIGTPIVFLVRGVFKPLCRRAVFVVCHWLGVPCYSYSQFSKTSIQLNKHYNSGFKLPPIYIKEKQEDATSSQIDALHGGDYLEDEDVTKHSNKSQSEMGSWPWPNNGQVSQVTLPLDIDNPTKFIVYCLMSWSAIESVYVIFFHVGLVAHST